MRAPLTLLLLAGFACALRARGGEDRAAFFESRIRPLLAEHCYECHSAGKKQKAGLVLDSRAGWEKGGDSGPAVVPRDPGESLLIKAVRWEDQDLRMPPEKAGGKLTEAQIGDLEQWVKRGAFDPRTSAAPVAPAQSWPEIFAQRKQWWSLQPLRAAQPPAGGGEGVDAFLRAAMVAAKVVPSGRADPRALIRRVALVLTGLPPTPAEVETFVAASTADPAAAWAALVDRRLASPHFGECFARHWLDVVRFTETHGNEWNYDVPYAWRYRDYVIRAFNDDLPYDQFVREQIAGDLLPPRWNAAGQFNESAIGTAFYRFGEVNHDSCVTFGSIGYDMADNQLDTLTKAFQATTVACARCHDHKLDAISTKDYHALLAILRSSREVQHTLDAPAVNRAPLAALQAAKGDLRQELAALWRAEAAGLDVARLQALAAAAEEPSPGWSDPLRPWLAVAAAPDIASAWAKLAGDYARETAERAEFNRAKFTTLADFRDGIPAGWHGEGQGLRAVHGDFAVSLEGDAALRMLLPAGVYTFALSDKLNGVLRSPTLARTHGKVSFEILGGHSSIARLVFNNCQLNYQNQQSLHHRGWSWVTADFPAETGPLHPYAELLTFWDSPKFPDPIATLAKDTENQRRPFAEHAKDPRTWWGVRRIVLHDAGGAPKDELSHLARLFAGPAPRSREELAARFAAIALDAVESFAAGRATDDDLAWLDWLLQGGLLSNRASATPELRQTVARYRQIESGLALPTMMPGMADEGPAFAQPVLLRGDFTRPGEPVPPAYIQALTPAGFQVSAAGSGRRELAGLIAAAENPLTARVMVNRLWQWVFGRGLVATPDDFGHLGAQPSHPELLDYLAGRLIAEGWSMKALVRSLVLSEAFQSDSAPTDEARQNDPQNLLLSHYGARRQEAESIRDSLLAVSGRLDPRMFGPSIHPWREKADPEKRLFTGPLDGEGRRSIYLKFQLMEQPRFLSAFNLPGAKIAQGRRDVTNVPAQSLAMLNDPFVLAMADEWSSRLVDDGSGSVEERVAALFREALARPPDAAERESGAAAVRRLAAAQGLAEAEILRNRAVWKDAAHMMFNLEEFIFIP